MCCSGGPMDAATDANSLAKLNSSAGYGWAKLPVLRARIIVSTGSEVPTNRSSGWRSSESEGLPRPLRLTKLVAARQIFNLVRARIVAAVLSLHSSTKRGQRQKRDQDS